MTTHATRRHFLQTSLATASGLALAATATGLEPAKKAAPNDRLALGFIGLGGMGTGSLGGFLKQPDVEVVALCDVYQRNLDHAMRLTGGKAKGFKDFRQLLDQKNIDAVVISTPDHWHALTAIHACQAKKHVYVEKPLSHTIAEGRAMVEAARKNNVVTQMGIQIHAGENYHRVVDVVRSGVLGKIHKTRVWVSRDYTELGRPPNSEPPAGLDWDLWSGPAPLHPFNSNRFLFNWRWFWDYGGGQQADMGCHVIDLVHWAMQVTAPQTVAASGGKWVLNSNTETPDTMEVIYEYPGFLMTYSNTMSSNQGLDRKGLGIVFHGTNGRLVADYSTFQIYDEKGRPVPPPKIENPIPRSPGHHRDWLDAIKTSRRCTADVEYGHQLTTVCHLGNIALRTGRKLRWNAQEERFVGDDEANGRLTKLYRKPWSL